ncbi:MAG: DUF433 domain-containing protein [Phycisphaerales bacterium]|nr:DUF433 domain-containing protein [Phycisphaerales bacterium]
MFDRIAIDPRVCHGKPVVTGTRVPVTIIVGSVAAGMSFADIQREYEVTVEDIRAALEYANSLVERDPCHPLAG